MSRRAARIRGPGQKHTREIGEPLRVAPARVQTIGLNRCQRLRFDAWGVYSAMRGDDTMRMQEIDVHDYARQLLEAHGAQAVVEAAQKACACERQGKREDAEIWRHIEAALKSMRGPHES
jgi:hypothetical protein